MTKSTKKLLQIREEMQEFLYFNPIVTESSSAATATAATAATAAYRRPAAES